jgi:Tol biopolymer transport system component
MSPENDELPITLPEDRNETPSLLPELLRRLGLEKGQQGIPSQADLLADLKHPAWYVRATAVCALGRLGVLAPQADLLLALDDPHLSVRANAVLALSTLGERTPVERLIQVLQSDPEWQVRESAVLALASLGQLAREESRWAALHDPDGKVREAARGALAQSRPALWVGRSAQPEAAAKTHHSSSFLRTLPGMARQDKTLHAHSYQEVTMSEKDFSPGTTTSTGARGLLVEPQRRAKHPVRRVVGLSLTAAVLMLMLLSWALLAHTLRVGVHGSSVGAPGGSPTAGQSASQRFSGKTLFTYTPGTGTPDFGNLMTVGWSPEGNYISVSGLDVTLLNAANGKVVKNLNASSASVWASWSSDGTRLVSSSTVAQVWDVKTGQVLATFTPRSLLASTAHGGGPLARLSGGNMIYASAFSPDGKYVASAIDGNGIGYDVQVWNAATGASIRTLQVKANANYSDYITQVGWSHDGRYIAAASPNNGVIVWDASTGQHVYTKQGADLMAWAPQADLLATTANATGLVQVWQATTGTVQSSFQGQAGGNTVYALSWSPNGTYIAASGHNVRVWDVTTNKLFGTYTGHGNDPGLSISGLAWSPDSTKIASLGTGMHVTAPHTGYPLDAVKVWEVRG